ncbi:MAG: hypothetical protein ALECFALPRED_001233 [Alectoria fallacina]|uniref:DUF7730 domain-containing protein n=1 Tax=Alectoria fallacina TaxID=1903189 RepID=A0A8H3PLH6_9LECA|nr:MAG: hypothetical protein ALECFALPRED_001233 [Alectoria fallacina]
MAQSPNHKHVPRLLPVIAVSDYERQQPVGYFSLPLEIRNMIMELVLVPGQVFVGDYNHIKRDHKSSVLQGTLYRMIKTDSKHSGRDSKSTRVRHPPGFQLLATCKQACAEGHAVFYTSNVFFMAPGPLENTHRCLKALKPQLRAMIRKVGITMSLIDLTPSVFEQVHHEMRVRYGNNIVVRPSLVQGTRWSELVEKQLRDIWKEKLDYILTHFRNVKLLRIVVPEDSRESQAEDLAEPSALFEEMGDTIYEGPKIRNALWRATKCVREDVEDMVSNDGWKALKGMVKKGAYETNY